MFLINIFLLSTIPFLFSTITISCATALSDHSRTDFLNKVIDKTSHDYFQSTERQDGQEQRPFLVKFCHEYCIYFLKKAIVPTLVY